MKILHISKKSLEIYKKLIKNLKIKKKNFFKLKFQTNSQKQK